MRTLLTICSVVLSFQLICAADISGQSIKKSNITYVVNEATVSEAFTQLSKLTGFNFFYDESVLENLKNVTLQVNNGSIDAILNELSKQTGLYFKRIENTISVSRQRLQSSESGVTRSDKKITGTITDSNGEPIPGANVIEKGTTNGVVSDLEGRFELNTRVGVVLKVSYIGFLDFEETVVVSKNKYQIVLKEDSQSLDEVVVVGYGIQKKKLVTGATVHVSGDDVLKMNSTSVLGALQSQSPGLGITKMSGQPGAGFKVTIRGIGTTGTSTPLYIVDGVVVGNINDLNSADVESVDVLKDAASASIYGSRAANGVILITTRQGKVGKASLQYDGYFAVQSTFRMPKPLNAQEYAMIMSEAARNSDQPEFNFGALVPDWDRIESGQWKGTNWLNEITNNNAPMQNHSLNLTGGTEQSTYSMGLSYLEQTGIFGKPANPSYQRYTFRANSEHVVARTNDFDILKIGENMTYTIVNDKSSLDLNSQNNNIRGALATNPFLPMYDKDGNYHYALPWFDPHANPYALIDYTEKGYEKSTYTLQGRIYAALQPIKDLIIQSSFGINSVTYYDRAYIPTFNIGQDPGHNRQSDYVSQSQSMSFRWIFDNTVSYKKRFKQHMLGGIVGMSAERTGIGQSISGSNQGSTFSDFKYAYLCNVPTISASTTGLTGAPLTDGRLLSFFGRINYDFKETYMASVVFRTDGSSAFAPKNRWGFFPSVSAGWVMSNESFMKSSSNWLDFMKLRVSWGQNGNSAIDPFQYLGTIYTSDPLAVYFPGVDKNTFIQGAYPDIAPNPDIKWETSEQLNLGFDSRYLGGRLNLSFDWYNKQTKDWLVLAPMLGSIGTGAPYINGGDVKNTGFEVSAGWQDKIKDLSYGVQANFSNNKNEVTRIANSEGIIHGATGIVGNATPEFYRAQVGCPIGYFWALKTDGVFQNQADIDAYLNSEGEKIMPNAKPGDLKFVNQDDNNIIDEKDRIMVGNPHPKFRFGASVNLEYKGFDFSMVTNGVLGVQIFKSYRNVGQRPLDNYTTEILGRWTGEGTSNKIPRVTLGNHINDAYISDRYIESGNYWRCSNMTLGYDFKKLFKSVPLQQLRLYFSAQNLFVVTPYSGTDPDVGQGRESWASGIDIGFYPNPRTFMIGASIKY